jgi:uncharacterized membrane protein
MRLPFHHASRVTRHESGMAVIVVMLLLSIILIYVAGNLRMLHHLNRDLQLVEQKQIRRLAITNATPNLLVKTNLPPPPKQPLN